MRIQEEVEDNDDIDIMAETLLTKLEQEKEEYGLLLRQQLETRRNFAMQGLKMRC